MVPSPSRVKVSNLQGPVKEHVCALKMGVCFPVKCLMDNPVICGLRNVSAVYSDLMQTMKF